MQYLQYVEIFHELISEEWKIVSYKPVIGMRKDEEPRAIKEASLRVLDASGELVCQASTPEAAQAISHLPKLFRALKHLVAAPAIVPVQPVVPPANPVPPKPDKLAALLATLEANLARGYKQVDAAYVIRVLKESM